MNPQRASDAELQQQLAQVRVPEHGDDFWQRLQSDLEVAAAGESRSRHRQSRFGPARSGRVWLTAAAVGFAAVALSAVFLPRSARQVATVAAGGSEALSTTTTLAPPGDTGTTVTNQPATTTTTTTPRIADGSEPPVLEGELVTAAWPDPAEVLTFDSQPGSMATVPGRHQLLHLEKRAELPEGCEGGQDPVYRLVLTDLESGRRQVVAEELPDHVTAIATGPDGRFALVATCDANGWLAAVGQLGEQFSVTSLPQDGDGAIRSGGNAGSSLTWTPDGQMLFFDDVRLDATTGSRLDPIPTSYDPDRPQVRAVAEDGWELFSLPSEDSGDRFWLRSPTESTVDAAQRPALFSGAATYPVAQVDIGSSNRKITVAVDQWEDTARTYIVELAPDDQISLVQVPGRAMLSPDDTRVLVAAGQTDYRVIDLANGESTPLPLLSQNGQQVMWSGNGDRILILPIGDDGWTVESVWSIDLMGSE